MGFMDVKCKCGCGNIVQRGSNYFLQQGQGLKFGTEVIDLYDSQYLSRIAEITAVTASSVDLRTLRSIRAKCAQLSDYMVAVAHEGPKGLPISRSEIERMNLFIVEAIFQIEKALPEEFAKLRVQERMSKPQKRLYETIKRRIR
jgi:hypothetical protein